MLQKVCFDQGLYVDDELLVVDHLGNWKPIEQIARTYKPLSPTSQHEKAGRETTGCRGQTSTISETRVLFGNLYASHRTHPIRCFVQVLSIAVVSS